MAEDGIRGFHGRLRDHLEMLVSLADEAAFQAEPDLNVASGCKLIRLLATRVGMSAVGSIAEVLSPQVYRRR